MSEPMKPALDAEGWEHREFCIGERDRLFGYIDSAGKLNLGWNGDPMRPVEDTAPLAALALADQPFGFTRKDVEILRRCETILLDWEERDDEAEKHVQLLADRIEALLPPE